jgi:hypothetical protein
VDPEDKVRFKNKWNVTQIAIGMSGEYFNDALVNPYPIFYYK